MVVVVPVATFHTTADGAVTVVPVADEEEEEDEDVVYWQ